MKAETFIIDIDGCILKHHNKGAAIQWNADTSAVLATTRATLDELEKRGAHIVLMTARPEHTRASLTRVLQLNGIVYHQLVMGVTSGSRILINDMKDGNQKLAAFAVNVLRNEGVTVNDTTRHHACCGRGEETTQ